MSTSKIVYLGNLSTQNQHIRSGNTIITDAPVDNNGKGEAFSPTDLAATSLASCALTIIGIKANSLGHNFENSTVELTKIMSEDSPRRISKIIMNFALTAKLDQDTKDVYQRVAKTCPVALSLHPDIVQEYNFKWI